MGKVEIMDLESTIKFIEAKESGKKAGLYLDGSEVDVNKVTGYRQQQREQVEHDRYKSKEVLVDETKCRYCGRKGHGAAPVLSRKKEVCPAYDKLCNACGGIGHFSKTKACRKLGAKVNMVEQCEIGDMGAKSKFRRAGVTNSKTETAENNGFDAAVVNEVEAVRYKLGTKVKLSKNRPVPHMVDVGGELLVALPREHPKLRVQLVVDVKFYKEHRLNLRLRRSCMTKQGKRAVVKSFLRVTLTPVLASHWILKIVLANHRPPLPLVARNIQPMLLSKITLQRPFWRFQRWSYYVIPVHRLAV